MHGADASAQWKAKVEDTIDNVFKCNDDRVLLAHSLLQPNTDGSVELVRLKVDHGKVTGGARTWSRDNFVTKNNSTTGQTSRRVEVAEPRAANLQVYDRI